MYSLADLKALCELIGWLPYNKVCDIVAYAYRIGLLTMEDHPNVKEISEDWLKMPVNEFVNHHCHN